MKMDKSHKIENCISPDTTREHLCKAYLDTEKKRLVATDGHMMAVVPVIVEEGDVSGFVTADAIKTARKVKVNPEVSIHCNGALAIDNGPTFARPTDGQFPPYEQVMPEYRQGDAGTITIGLNAGYLHDLMQALGSPKSGIVSLTIPVKVGEDGKLDAGLEPIVVGTSNAGGAVGVLMPARV